MQSNEPTVMIKVRYRSMAKKILPVVLCIGFIECSGAKKKGEISEKVNTQPNIVYILADDMGYGDISALNPESGVQTPNMDKIIDEGIYFTDAHSNSSVCTPTRYGILTGRYAWRSELKEGVLWGYDSPLIESKRVTVASFLKDNGYNTACIGKWHLGLGWQPKDTQKPISKYNWKRNFEKGADSNVDFSKRASGPNELGFDYSYIIPGSLDMSPYLYLENGIAVDLPTAYTEGKSQENAGRGVFWRTGEVSPSFDFYKVLPTLTGKAVAYIKSQEKEDTPFFLYFPLTAPHTPWLPSESSKGKSKAGTYGDFVAMVDNTVGKVVEVLKQSGKIENTLIIVTSDNGAHWTPEDKKNYAHRANVEFRGQKADIYEGGHHIPYISKWPEKIKPGTSSKQIMCTTDLLATVAGILNKKLPEGAGEDSHNMLPAYIKTATKPIRDHAVHHSLNGLFAIRMGKWKLTTALGSGGFSIPVATTPKLREPKGTLYDMEKDPKETINLYQQHPEVVQTLLNALKKIKNE